MDAERTPDAVAAGAQPAYRLLQDGGFRPSRLKFDPRRGEWVMYVNSGERMTELAGTIGLKGWSARKWTALLVWTDTAESRPEARVFHGGRRERRVEDAMAAALGGAARIPEAGAA